MTIGEALAAATETLDRNRVPSSRLTAEILLAHCLRIERPGLYARHESAIEPGAERAYRGFIQRRALGEPLQYITGYQEFYGYRFRVTPSVLIPRPETEFVVETVLRMNEWETPRIVDVGTGSGCIGIALALEMEDRRVTVTDISTDALEVARGNAAELNAPVAFLAMDGLGAIAGRFEFIVSNPPYVSAREYRGLQREVREHEPRIALVPGTVEPIRLYEQLVADASEQLVSGGFLVMEIGYSMEDAVRGLFDDTWSLLPTCPDLQGIPRVVVARRP